MKATGSKTSGQMLQCKRAVVFFPRRLQNTVSRFHYTPKIHTGLLSMVDRSHSIQWYHNNTSVWYIPFRTYCKRCWQANTMSKVCWWSVATCETWSGASLFLLFSHFNYPLPHRTLLPIIIYCLQIVLFLRICLTFNFNCLLSSSRTLVSMLFRN